MGTIQPSGGNTKQLFDQLQQLDTEQRNPASMHIDTASPAEIVRIINEQDITVAAQVKKRSAKIAAAISVVEEALRSSGRLIYAGAGTSGRLGVLDAAECPPTFGTNPQKIIGLIAGGPDAMFVAQEGAEDREENGRRALEDINLQPADVVCGIAASGRTPYVLGALQKADATGCATIIVTTVPAGQSPASPRIMIDVPVGPEAIMGSTRMKSATAQKMVLNMISTGAMIRLGKVYENVMVDLQPSNKKLEERSKRIIMMLTKATYEEAAEVLENANGHVKTAVVMQLMGGSAEEARQRLAQNDGFIRKATAANAAG